MQSSVDGLEQKAFPVDGSTEEIQVEAPASDLDAVGMSEQEVETVGKVLQPSNSQQIAEL